MKKNNASPSKRAPKGKYPISTALMATILSELASKQGASWWQRFGKVGFAGIAAIVLVGGTAAALTFWPEPTVTLMRSSELPNGNRIIGIQTTDCHYFNGLDGSVPKPTTENIYYEVRKDTTLSDKQLLDALRGVCEENLSNNAVSALVDQLPADMPNIQSTQAYIVDAITDSSITVTPDPHYDPAFYTTLPGLTYSNFAKDLLVYNYTTKIAFSDIKAGDSIKMIVQDTTASNGDSDATNSLNNPNTIVIVGIVKIPALTASPDLLWDVTAKDLVRTEPCESDPTGFCRSYEFIESQ